MTVRLHVSEAVRKLRVADRRADIELVEDVRTQLHGRRPDDE